MAATPQSAKPLLSAPPPDTSGYPSPFAGRIAATLIPAFQTYYPTYQQLDPKQKLAYVYIRQEFWNGYSVADAPLSYLFLCAYEIGQRAPSLKSFIAHMTSLRTLYNHDAKFATYLAHWILDARLAAKIYSWDEIAEAATAKPGLGLSRLDVQLLAGARPDTASLFALATYRHVNAKKRERLIAAVELVRARFDEDPILASARSGTDDTRKASLFGGYPGRVPGLPNYYDRRVDVPTFLNPNSSAMKCVSSVIEEASQLIGEAVSSADDHLEFTRTVGSRQTVPIVRTSKREQSPVLGVEALAALEQAAGSLDVLEQSIESLWTFEMRLLMGLVLWQAENKPYIEGLINFSRELRVKYETLASALHAESGITPYRRAFYSLSRGKLAPWSLDVPLRAVTDLKIGLANARFTKALQRELRGSAARARIAKKLVQMIATDTGLPLADVVDAFTRTSGASQPTGFSAVKST